MGKVHTKGVDGTGGKTSRSKGIRRAEEIYGNKEVVSAAKKRKRGGMVDESVCGRAQGGRLDRARGGKAGIGKSPFSTAGGGKADKSPFFQ